ncbi:MAG: anti-sigma factor family protein [Chthonomonadales bacterium]
MRCDTARDHFSDYASGHAHEALRAALDLHLADCPSCRREVEDLKLLWRALDQLEVVEAPPSLRSEVWRRIDAEAQLQQQLRPRTLANLLAGRAAWQRVTAWGVAVCLVALLAGITVPGNYQRALLGDLGFRRLLPGPTVPEVTARVSSVTPVADADQLFDDVVITVEAKGPARRVRVTPSEGRVVGAQDVIVGTGQPSDVVLRLGHSWAPRIVTVKIQEQAHPQRETDFRLAVPQTP